MQRRGRVMAILAVLGTMMHVPASLAAGEQGVEELRNTLVGVMEALVQRGLLTREQAQEIVRTAQEKAAAAARAQAMTDEAERNAVVVARIPESVKQDIVRQVGEEVKPQVTEEVLRDARENRWGVPGAMPDWLSRISLSGDLRVRAQLDNFAEGNIPNLWLDHQAINEAGSLSGAGVEAFHNVTEDRQRVRIRGRFGVDARISDGLSAVMRLSTGSAGDPVSPNQTLGRYGKPFQVVLDRAYLDYSFNGGRAATEYRVMLGRVPNPWVTQDLVWDPDLNFDGVTGSARFSVGDQSGGPRGIFGTVGVFPLQEIERSGGDKWIYGAQIGGDYSFASGLQGRLAVAYYVFDNVAGRRNDVDSTLQNHSAPLFMQKGNTVFDILNDANPDSYLFALAPDYEVLDLIATLQVPLADYRVTFTGEYIDNLGYDQNSVLRQFGYSDLAEVPDNQLLTFKARTNGWLAGVTFNTQTTGTKGDWRASIAYRHLERDATLDAFTDSDFRLGGTAAKGFVLRGDWWFRDRNWVSLRYYSTDEVSHSMSTPSGQFTDLSPFGVDTLMLDLNAQF